MPRQAPAETTPSDADESTASAAKSEPRRGRGRRARQKAAAESSATTGAPVTAAAATGAPPPVPAAEATTEAGRLSVATPEDPAGFAESSATIPEVTASAEAGPAPAPEDHAGSAGAPEVPTAEVEVEDAADVAPQATEGATAAPDDSADPPETELGDDGELSENAAVPKGPSRQRGLRSALATLPVPNPAPSFWADIDRAMAEQQPLSINARPAIRPITEPPPLSQPSLSDHFGSSAILVTADRPASSFDDNEHVDVAPPRAPSGASDAPLRPGPPLPKLLDPAKANTRRTVLIVVGVILVLLIVGNFMDGQGDDPSGAETAGTTVPSTTTTTVRPTTTVPSVPGLDPNAALTPAGLGPLTIGTSLRDLNAAGARTTVDQATFATSGGACYDAKLPGAPDLTLRFRSPDPDTGVADPQEGVLASIGITIAPGSPRVTETGVRLGSTEDQVRAAHQGSLEINDHPTNPGGHLMLARQRGGTGLGFAYGTDGTAVTEIVVGYNDAISQRQGCS